MNKTVSTSLGGFVFHIEEQGYEKLQAYLSDIRSRLRGDDDVDEIMEDIESRIAELFMERNGNRKEVVTEKDVDEVITIMGSPEEFGEAAATDDPESADEEPTYTETKRKIYRDEDNQMLGGVCSGIANYFDWDPAWVRLAFLGALFFLGTGVLLYIALWIVLPVASTTAEKLEAKGKKVDAKSIKEHVKRFQKDIENMDSKETREKFRNAGKQMASSFGKIFGLFALVVGSGMLIALVYWIFTKDFIISVTNTGVHGISLGQFMDMTLTDTQSVLLDIGVIGLLGGPIVGLFTMSVRWFFGIYKKIKTAVIVSSSMWGVGLILVTIAGVDIARDRSNHYPLRERIEVNTSEDLVYVDIMDDAHFSEKYRHSDGLFFELIKVDNDEVHLGWPKLDIHPAEGNDYEMVVIKESRGRTQAEAIENAESISYRIKVKNHHIYLAPHFSYEKADLYKGQDVTVILKVPEGKSVKLSPRMGRILYDVKNEEHLLDDHMGGKTWTMIENELTRKFVTKTDTVYVPEQVSDTLAPMDSLNTVE